MKARRPSLESAYALETPEDSVALYRDWASSYDTGFAAERGYVYAREVARIFCREAGPHDTPVLDIGAGTGLVAEHLDGTVDGIDISAEMLEVAGSKGLYRNRIVADLTGPLPLGAASYGGLVSAGTFTHGHVGPGCLPELLRIARPGALFCIGINEEVFDSAGFGSAFAAHVATGAITPLGFERVRIYERAADGLVDAHTDDTCLVATFRRR